MKSIFSLLAESRSDHAENVFVLPNIGAGDSLETPLYTIDDGKLPTRQATSRIGKFERKRKRSSRKGRKQRGDAQVIPNNDGIKYRSDQPRGLALGKDHQERQFITWHQLQEELQMDPKYQLGGLYLKVMAADGKNCKEDLYLIDKLSPLSREGDAINSGLKARLNKIVLPWFQATGEKLEMGRQTNPLESWLLGKFPAIDCMGEDSESQLRYRKYRYLIYKPVCGMVLEYNRYLVQKMKRDFANPKKGGLWSDDPMPKITSNEYPKWAAKWGPLSSEKGLRKDFTWFRCIADFTVGTFHSKGEYNHKRPFSDQVPETLEAWIWTLVLVHTKGFANKVDGGNKGRGANRLKEPAVNASYNITEGCRPKWKRHKSGDGDDGNVERDSEDSSDDFCPINDNDMGMV